MLFLTSWPKLVCVQLWAVKQMIVPSQRQIHLSGALEGFLSLRCREPLLKNVPHVKPLAEHSTASTGPFLLYTHILRFLWTHHCQRLQMEKGSQIPLLVKRRKCSRCIFLSFYTYPQLLQTVFSLHSKCNSVKVRVDDRPVFCCWVLRCRRYGRPPGPTLSGYPLERPGARTCTPELLTPYLLCRWAEPKQMLQMEGKTKQRYLWWLHKYCPGSPLCDQGMAWQWFPVLGSWMSP